MLQYDVYYISKGLIALMVNKDLRELKLVGLSLVFWGTLLTIIWGAVDTVLDISLPFGFNNLFDVIAYVIIFIGLLGLRQYSKGFRNAAVAAAVYVGLSLIEFFVTYTSRTEIIGGFNTLSFIMSILLFLVSVFMVCTILLSLRKLCLRHGEQEMADMCDGWAKVYFIFKVVGYIGITMSLYFDSIIFLFITIFLVFITLTVEILYISFLKKCKKLLDGREYYANIRR